MSSFTCSPPVIPKSHAGSVYVLLTGTGTSWSGATVFTATGLPTGATYVGSSSVTSTSAVLEFTTGSGTGTITVGDGTTTTALPVAASSMAPAPSAGSLPLSSTVVVEILGTNTAWSSESGGSSRPNFAISGVAGCTLVSAYAGSDPADNEDTNADLTITTGSTAGTLTITDNGTGITTTIPVGSTFHTLAAVPGTSVEIGVRFDGGTWVDISTDVRSFTTTISRSRTLGMFPPGTATFNLDNRTGKYTPLNSSSPYYGTILPGRHVRMRAKYSATEYDVWYGIVEDWGDSYPQAKDGIATVTAYQPSRLLAGYRGDTGSALVGVGELTSARVSRILTAAGWSLGSTVETGLATMQGSDLTSDALTGITDAVEVELGAFWIDPNGSAQFESRYALEANSRSNSSQATFGPADVPYLTEPGPQMSSGLDLVINKATRSNTGGYAFTSTNSTSVALIGQTVASSDTSLKGAEDAWAAGNAQAATLIYGTPVQHPTRISLRPTSSTTAPQCLGRRIRDLVTVKVPVPWSATLTSLVFIVGISHSASPQTGWVTTFEFEPATVYTGISLFTLDTSALDGTDILGW